MIEKLDGPKGDPIVEDGKIIGEYLGEIVAGELADGDWVRFTDSVGVSEHRWFAPIQAEAKPAPDPKTPTTIDQVKSSLAELTALINTL